MDHSRSSLPNVDRANSTLFKRYLEEQHKSIVKTSTHQTYSRPVNTTLHIQQHEIRTTEVKTHVPAGFVKRKTSHGRKLSADPAKQRTSHTNRFMRRLQRQYKQGDTGHQVPRREDRSRFEFHPPPPPPPTSNEHGPNCTCLPPSNGQLDKNHRCPMKTNQVPRLSLSDAFQALAQRERNAPIPQPSSTLISRPSILVPTKLSRSPSLVFPPLADETTRSESISTSTYPVEEIPRPPPPAPVSAPVDATASLLIEPVPRSLSNDQYSFLNHFLQELSLELTDEPSADILLEIEGSLAQRIYDCVVEREDDNEQDTNSFSTTTADSSTASVPVAPVNKSIDLPSSPIKTSVKELTVNREKYFQPIREPPSPIFNPLLDQHRHSTPFNRPSKLIPNDSPSPFIQSILEPVNLLRTVTTDEPDAWNFLSGPFTFETSQTTATRNHLSTMKPHDRSAVLRSQQSLPFVNHLLLPRTTPIEANLSAFKPLESGNSRSTSSFVFKRPTAIGRSTESHWFGQN